MLRAFEVASNRVARAGVKAAPAQAARRTILGDDPGTRMKEIDKEVVAVYVTVGSRDEGEQTRVCRPSFADVYSRLMSRTCRTEEVEGQSA